MGGENESSFTLRHYVSDLNKGVFTSDSKVFIYRAYEKCTVVQMLCQVTQDLGQVGASTLPPCA
jgi:hypothetical protein